MLEEKRVFSEEEGECGGCIGGYAALGFGIHDKGVSRCGVGR